MNEAIKAKIAKLATHVSVLREKEVKAENMDGGHYLSVEEVEKLITELLAKPKK